MRTQLCRFVAGTCVIGALLALLGPSESLGETAQLVVTCPPPGNPCIVSAIPQPNAPCKITYKPAGTPCNDGNACTYGETCSGGGVCGVFGQPPKAGTVSCTNPTGYAPNCATASCNGTSSCTYTPVAVGTPCGPTTLLGRPVCAQTPLCGGMMYCAGAGAPAPTTCPNGSSILGSPPGH
jgi:hypothetical protein